MAQHWGKKEIPVPSLTRADVSNGNWITDEKGKFNEYCCCGV